MKHGDNCLDQKHRHDNKKQPIHGVLLNLRHPPYQETRMKPKHKTTKKCCDIRKNPLHRINTKCYSAKSDFNILISLR